MSSQNAAAAAPPLPGDVIHHEGPGGAPVVRAGDGPEALLARRVPDLQLHLLAMDLHDPGAKLHADGVRAVGHDCARGGGRRHLAKKASVCGKTASGISVHFSRSHESVDLEAVRSCTFSVASCFGFIYAKFRSPVCGILHHGLPISVRLTKRFLIGV